MNFKNKKLVLFLELIESRNLHLILSDLRSFQLGFIHLLHYGYG